MEGKKQSAPTLKTLRKRKVIGPDRWVDLWLENIDLLWGWFSRPMNPPRPFISLAD
jgi:hypothetical protein